MSRRLTNVEKFYIEQQADKKSAHDIAADLGRDARTVRAFYATLPRWNPRHEQVPIEWEGFKAAVDVELAPLILSLWQAGIRTILSCQENKPGIVWIEFPTPLDAKMFLDRVARYPDAKILREVNGRLYVEGVPFWETLYGHITGCGSPRDWEYTVHPFNWNVEEDIVDDTVEERCIGPSDFEFSVSIRFPRTDLPDVVERVRSHEERPKEYQLVAGYCGLCRGKEMEMYGDIVNEAGPRHTAAVKAAGCRHPAEYRFPALLKQGEVVGREMFAGVPLDLSLEPLPQDVIARATRKPPSCEVEFLRD